MPSRSTQRDSAFNKSIAALIGSGQWDLARRTIEAALHAARTGERFTQLLDCFESMPPTEPDDLAAARLHLRLHVNVPRQP